MVETITTTQRLSISKMRLEDASFLHELMNSEAWIKNIGDRKVPDIPATQHYIRQNYIEQYANNGFGFYKVSLKNQPIPIGITGFAKRNNLHNVDIGFGFLEPFWGKGYAYEAANAVYDFGKNKLGFPIIDAITLENNLGSIHLLTKLGLSLKEKIMMEGEELLLFTDQKLENGF